MDAVTMVREGMAVNLVGAACLTVLLYDHAITLDQEISQMWPSRWSIPKCLFFVNRYPVVAMLLFNCICPCISDVSNCRTAFSISDGLRTTTISTSVVQGILVLRVWALYRRNKYAIYIAYFFYIGGTATLIGLVIKDYVGESVLINISLQSLPGCYANSVPSIIAGFWISPLIVETVLFLLVVFYARELWNDGMGIPRIFGQLARDSTLYFTIVFGLLLANFLMFQLGPPFLSSLLVTPSTTAGCILGSHMILNMRTLIYRTDGNDLTEDSATAPGPDYNGNNVNSNRSRRRAYRMTPIFANVETFDDGADTIFHLHQYKVSSDHATPSLSPSRLGGGIDVNQCSIGGSQVTAHSKQALE